MIKYIIITIDLEGNERNIPLSILFDTKAEAELYIDISMPSGTYTILEIKILA